MGQAVQQTILILSQRPRLANMMKALCVAVTVIAAIALQGCGGGTKCTINGKSCTVSSGCCDAQKAVATAASAKPPDMQKTNAAINKQTEACKEDAAALVKCEGGSTLMALESSNSTWTVAIAAGAGAAGGMVAVAMLVMLSRRFTVREPTLLG